MTKELLAELSRLGVKLWVEHDQLRYRAPKGVLTPSMMAALSKHKAELLELLSTTPRGNFPSLRAMPEERYQPFPTTDVQQAYWVGRNTIFELGNVGNHGYIELEAVDFELKRSIAILQRLIERHEMLRAVMLPDGRQRILEQVPAFGVEIEDLQALPAPLQELRLLEVRQQMDHELLPLEEWPAFRIRVSRLSPQRVRLHLSVESLFIDAWSMHILIQEFIRLYGDPEAELGALEISFRDYVLAEQRVQEHLSFQRAQAYWTQRLASLPPAPELPLARTPTTLQQPHFVHYESRLAAPLWQTLKARGAQADLTPSGILLAAFAHVLAAWSKTAHFCLNLTLFRRLPLHPQINALVGDFTSLTLLEVDCRGQRSFEERARLLQEQLWRDLDHSDYSGVRVLRDLARTQGGKVGALMPVVFTSLLVQDTGSASRAPWQETIYCVTQTPQVWLDHQVLEEAGKLVFYWQAVEALFPEGFLEAMFDAYCRLLQRLVTEEETWHTVIGDLVPEVQLEQPAPGHATEDVTSSIQTPEVETTLLARITQVIESVLGVHSLAPEANLLEYGATSVSIIRIINLLEKDFHCRPRLNEFFHFPTIMWLAIVYEQHLRQSQVVKGRTGEDREEGDL